MSHMTLSEIVDLEVIYQADEFGRDIKLYSIENCQFEENKIFYPEVLLYSYNQEKQLNPINEKILSLEKMTIKKEETFKLKKLRLIESSPVFYFIYNTDNYYHFIYDSLPYLISFYKLKEKVPNIKLLINYPNRKTTYIYNFVTEFLEILGIKNEDLLFISNETLYKKIYISSSYTHGIDSNLPPKKEIYNFFKKIVNSQKNYFKLETPKKVYISRRSWIHNDFSNIGTNYTLKRKMVNEDDLVDLILKNGYSEIFTEKLNSIEKLNLFYNAERIIGAIGGGLCNVLFSQPETKLLSIVSPTFLDVNKRFKYSLDNINTEYFFGTNHLETGEFKTGMRVECKNTSVVGEIAEINGDDLVIRYTNEMVAGWNNQIDFEKIVINKNLCTKLDGGLNSPFLVDISGINEWIHSNEL